MLRLGTIMSERDLTSMIEVLTKLVNHIDEVAPEGPSYAHPEANKTEFIRKSVLGYEWSNNAIRNIVYSNYSFN